MNISTPNIHLFKTRGGNYFYDVNRHKIVKVSGEVYKLLIRQRRGENVSHLKIDKLIEQGFLSSKRISEIIHPLNDFVEDYLNNKVRKITLQLTQQCNFRCSYCVYSDNNFNRDHSNKRMNIDTAKKAIDFLINHSRSSPEVNISFYGGEPLLEFEMIKECIDYAEKLGEGKNIFYSLTSNGSLLNDEIIEYFIRHQVQLMISLDGPKEINDKNRVFAGNGCGTYDKVFEGINLIKNKYPEYYKNIQFSTVIDPEVDLNCSKSFFSSEDIFEDKTLYAGFLDDKTAKQKAVVAEDFQIKWEYETFKMLLSMCNRLDEKCTSKLVYRLRQDMEKCTKGFNSNIDCLNENDHPSGPCIPGQIRLFIDADGNFYPCEKVVETCDIMNIGSLEQGFDIEKIKMLLSIGKLTEEECKNCFSVRECTVCCGQAVEVNEYTKGLSKYKKLSQCAAVRRTVEDKFMNLCSLQEFGYAFSGIINFGEN
ncbi:MAG: Cys-rich peptide radical SAM maturase CcpM [Clostridia bacterium]|nr:Cys-rich peptide radical SAM maturase CcpM [Clostridia bacterium]